MTDNISRVLIAYALTAPFFTILVHVVMCRFSAINGTNTSPQALLAKIIIVFNVLLFIGTWVLGEWVTGNTGAHTVSDYVPMFLFSLIIFNGITYAYFHFFNMSETARRVKMLLIIQKNSGISESELISMYSPRDMIDSRLTRLQQMKQIVVGENSNYYISGKLLLYIAKTIRVFRLVIRFK